MILLEKKKNGDEHDWSDNGINSMHLNEYNPPVILLEKKKKNGDEHDWSDNGLNCTVLRNTAALNENSPTVILLEKEKNGVEHDWSLTVSTLCVWINVTRL